MSNKMEMTKSPCTSSSSSTACVDVDDAMSSRSITATESVAPSDDDQNFLPQLISAINLDDIERVNQTQKNMLNRFEKTNEMLVNCNALSRIHFDKLSADYRRHTGRLVEMQKDLDCIFHRVRRMRTRIKQKYPDICVVDEKTLSADDEDHEDEDEDEDENQNQITKSERKADAKNEVNNPEKVTIESSANQSQIETEKSIIESKDHIQQSTSSTTGTNS